MKTLRPFFFLFAFIFVFSQSCRKDSTLPVQKVQESFSIASIHNSFLKEQLAVVNNASSTFSVFNPKVFKSTFLKWNRAKFYGRGSSRTLAVPVTDDFVDGLGRQLLVTQNKGVLQYLYLEASTEKGKETDNPALFNGSLTGYNLRGDRVYSSSVINGTTIEGKIGTGRLSNSLSISNKPVPSNHLAGPLLECECPDDDGIKMYCTSGECIVIIPGSGGGGAGIPQAPPYDGGGGGGGNGGDGGNNGNGNGGGSFNNSNGDGVPITPPKIICPPNFAFVPTVSDGSWQEAIITGFGKYMLYLDVDGFSLSTQYVYIPEIHIGLPQNGDYVKLNADQAAKAAADAFNTGAQAMTDYFKANPNLMAVQYAAKMLSTMQYALKDKGGRVATSGSSGPPRMAYVNCQ